MISLTIGGVERSGSVEFSSLRRQNRINEQPDTLTFTIRKGGDKTYTPAINDEVILTVNSTKEFGGVIVRVEQKLENPDLIKYKVTCSDYARLLDRQLVTQNYTSTDIDTIIADLIANFTTGFTGTNVDAPISVESISFNRLTVSQCLEKLAERSNYFWYVDYDKDIHFMAKQGESAPFDAVEGNYIYESLQKEDDISQLRNTILVQGGDKEGSSRTITREGSEVSDEGVLDLQYKFSEKPTVTVDSGGGAVAQDVGIDFLDDDVDFDVMWNFNEKYLRFTSGSIPGATDEIDVSGTPLIPIIVEVPDDTSIAEFGVFEFAIKDTTIKSEDEAIDRAIAEINAYGDSIVDGEFETYKAGLRAGQTLQITDTFRDIDEKVLIQSVDMQVVTPTADRLKHKVRFATFRNIGIIDFLQKQLREDEISEQNLETLLSFLRLSDSGSFSESIATSANTAPYKWAPSADSFDWNFGVWN